MKTTISKPVWATNQDALPGIYKNPNESDYLAFYETDMTDMGWIRIGTATIHLDLIDPKDTVAAQVESLQAKITKTMADGEAAITILRSRINDLLAIENSGGEK